MVPQFRRVCAVLFLFASIHCALVMLLQKGQKVLLVKGSYEPYPNRDDKFRMNALATAPLLFEFPINEPRLCAEDEYSNPSTPFLLIEVHSHASNKPSRDAIRDTWGRISREFFREKLVRVVFILGSVVATDHEMDVRRESKLYRDLISADFVDSYRNLTLKSLAGLYWAGRFCPGARYLLKTDDDVYFNVSKLLEWLDTADVETGIVGRANVEGKVYRMGLWKVDETLYSAPMYPRYCLGSAYLLTSTMAGRLFNASRRVPLIPIEDVYVTGLLAKSIGTRCTNNMDFPQWGTGPTNKNLCSMFGDSRAFAVHRVDYTGMYVIQRRSREAGWCRQYVRTFSDALSQRIIAPSYNNSNSFSIVQFKKTSAKKSPSLHQQIDR